MSIAKTLRRRRCHRNRLIPGGSDDATTRPPSAVPCTAPSQDPTASCRQRRRRTAGGCACFCEASWRVPDGCRRRLDADASRRLEAARSPTKSRPVGGDGGEDAASAARARTLEAASSCIARTTPRTPTPPRHRSGRGERGEGGAAGEATAPAVERAARASRAAFDAIGALARREGHPAPRAPTLTGIGGGRSGFDGITPVVGARPRCRPAAAASPPLRQRRRWLAARALRQCGSLGRPRQVRPAASPARATRRRRARAARRPLARTAPSRAGRSYRRFTPGCAHGTSEGGPTTGWPQVRRALRARRLAPARSTSARRRF